jgi:hypothetical protein
MGQHSRTEQKGTSGMGFVVNCWHVGSLSVLAEPFNPHTGMNSLHLPTSAFGKFVISCLAPKGALGRTSI